MRMSKQEREAEAEAVLAEIPRVPSRRVVDDFMAEPYENMRSVFRSKFVRDEESGKSVKAVGVTCGHCREEYIFPYFKLEYDGSCCRAAYGLPQDEYGFIDDRGKVISSGDTYRCPVCGCSSTVYGFARLKHMTLASLERPAVELRSVHGHTVIINWNLIKTTDRDGNEEFCCQRVRACFQVDGRMFSATGYEYFGQARYMTPSWNMLSKFSEYMGGFKKRRIYWNPRELEGTPEFNDGLIAVLRRGGDDDWIYPETYLDLWAKAPIVENVAKTYPEYMYKLISAAPVGGNGTVYAAARRLMDLKKIKPHEIIGLEKELLSMYADRIGPETAYIYRMARRMKADVPEEVLTVNDREAAKFNLFLTEDIYKEVAPPFGKLVRYCLLKNRERIFDFQYLVDYWRMTIRSEGRVSPEIMFPRDLRAAHDRAMKKYQSKKDKAKNDAIKAQAKEARALEYTDEKLGLFIRPARSASELIIEGRELCHCVATYADSVAKGLTNILFIRRIDAPETPFFTLEYRNGKVIQNRGLHNCERTPEVKAFEEKWLKHIKEDRNGKRNRSQTAAAGA